MSVSPASAGKVTADAPRKPTLRHLLEDTDRFLVAVELVTSRGVISDLAGQRALSHARALAESPRIDVLSITDNPAGNAMLAADTLGAELRAQGQEVIIHLACKDGNRNSLESRGWKLASEGFDNILALTGDYPKPGYGGMARPSFDIDSVGLLSMYSDMNRGLRDVKGRRMKATNFFLGAVVTNHKRYEREVIPQYLKLRRKIENGARFIINQAGYDARKDDELVRWLALSGLQVPVIANVFLLSLGAARAFNAGRVPGVVVTDELVALAEHYAGSADRGRSFFLELAAKQVAIARGVGFRGAYLGGKLDLADCEEILARAEAFGRDGWKQVAGDVGFGYPDEFYYFERDDTTGLSTSEVSGALLASRTKAARRHARLRTPINYRTSRLAHWAVFDPEAPLFGAARRFYSAVESAPAPARKVLRAAEHFSKVPLYNCKDCGDCSLPEIAYLCPESQCAKNQRNGPCGGSHDGLCEVAERECIWARAYERLKPYGEEISMLDGPVVFNDYALRGTSAWANTFLGRDHTARPAAGQEDVK